jgi:superfamily II DNA helicase RecQ
MSPEVTLKPEQLGCLKAIFFGVDCAAILPTGYGKSWIMQLLPLMFDCLLLLRDGSDPVRGKHSRSIGICVNPLKDLANDQIYSTAR